MLASETIKELQELINKYGDLPVARCDDGFVWQISGIDKTKDDDDIDVFCV